MNKDSLMLSKSKCGLAAIVITVGLGFQSLAQAQTTDPTATGLSEMSGVLEQIKTEITNFYSSFKEYYGLSLGEDEYVAPIYFKTPDIQAIKDSATAVKNINADSSIISSGQLLTRENILTLTTTPPDYRLCLNCAQSTDGGQVYSAIDLGQSFLGTLTDYGIPWTLDKYGKFFKSNVVGDQGARTKFQNNTLPQQASMSLDALLGPRGYAQQTSGSQTIEESDLAAKFIKMAGGLTDPLPLENSLPDEPTDPNASNPRLRYILKVLNYAARTSVGIANLNQSLAKRIKSGDDNKSPLEHEYDMASRRLSNEWHEQMEQAAPLAIQREMLYTLAEMNYQMFQMRQQNERLLTTVSILQLQLLEMNKSTIR